MTALDSTPVTEDAKRRLLAEPGDPLVHVEWRRVLFLNHYIAPEVVRSVIPAEFELELHRGEACVSLVALTMRNFHHANGSPSWGRVFNLLKEQRFLNLRTYVRHRDESGAYFIHGWLSRPMNLPLPNEPLGLSCAFADIRYMHAAETGSLNGLVQNRNGSFQYEGGLGDPNLLRPCEPGSLEEFALEHYSGFYSHHGSANVFRAWHAPWEITPVNLRVKDTSLITERFPWFRNAKFASAVYAPGFETVWLGRAHRLNRRHHHGASSFFEMP